MIIDIIVLIILLISAGIAFMRGFIREVLTIAGVAGGAAAAYFGGSILNPHMASWFGVEDGVEPERLFGVLPYDILALALSYGIIFLVVVIALSFTSHALAEAARKIGLGAIDRSFGFLFGLIRGLLLVGLIYLPVHLFVGEQTREEWFKDSKTHIYMEKTSAAMASYLPTDTKDQMSETAEKIEKGLDAHDQINQIKSLNDTAEQPISPDDTTAADRIKHLSPEEQHQILEGYSDTFRNDMDQLIDENANPQLNE